MTINLERITIQEIVRRLFIVFCMCPFILQFPGLSSDNQPYALLFGMLLILLCVHTAFDLIVKADFAKLLFFSAFIAVLVLLWGGITVGALRGFFNHLSLFIVPLAYGICFSKEERHYEKMLKTLLLIWFFVAVVQLFVSRSFMTQIIANPRGRMADRGVLGLASEPSFFGISCFYFLHIAMKFKKNSILYMLIATVMGVVFAQSTMGIIFIVVFWVAYLFENITSKKGVILFITIALGLSAGYTYLSNNDSDLRVFKLVNTFFEEGFTAIYEDDESTNTRMNSIEQSLESFNGANFLPQGYGTRIGSGYGGFLCELGLFAIIELLVISYGFSLQFTKTRSRILYFVLVSALLFSNTQIGNPQLLFVLGMNYFESKILKGGVDYEQNSKI